MVFEHTISDKDGISNPTLNAIFKRINFVLCNIVCIYNIQETYADEDEPCMGILLASAFAKFIYIKQVQSNNPVPFIFGHDINIPIKDTE